MPELPEVEAWKRAFEKALLDSLITEVVIVDPELLEGRSAKQMVNALQKTTLKQIERRGKFLIFRTDGAHHLVLHLGMSGRYKLAEDKEVPEHARLVLRFDNGYQLAYLNQRSFGVIRLAKEPTQLRNLRALGPEPLSDELTPDVFYKMLNARRRPLKPLLTDQAFLAGIGNVFADEMLFHAGLRPDRRAAELPPAECERLHTSMRSVLTEAIEAISDSQPLPKTWLSTRRDEGEDCPRCGFPLVRMSVSKRAATFCRRCQK